MDVNELLKVKGNTIITVQLGDPLRAVVQLMSEHKIGSVVVNDANGNLAGIISERDFVRGLQVHGPDLIDKSVDDLVTSSVH